MSDVGVTVIPAMGVVTQRFALFGLERCSDSAGVLIALTEVELIA